MTWICSKGFRLLHRIRSECESVEGPRRCSDTNVGFHTYSRVFQVHELVNSHSNLRPGGIKHTHSHTDTLNTPKAPCRYPAEPWVFTHPIFIHLYSHWINMTHRLPTFFTFSMRFWRYTQPLKCFSMSFPILSLSPPIHSPSPHSLFLPGYKLARPPIHPSIHPTNMLAYKHCFLESKTTRGIWLEYGIA